MGLFCFPSLFLVSSTRISPAPREGLEAAAHKGVPQQVLRCGPPLLLHKDLLEEVTAAVRDAVWELRLGRLGGNFENGCHGFKFCPGWLLC